METVKIALFEQEHTRAFPVFAPFRLLKDARNGAPA